MTYVVIVIFAAAVVECCFANQINKWRRRRWRKKGEKTDGSGAIIGDEGSRHPNRFAVRSRFKEHAECGRPKHDDSLAEMIEGRVPQKRSRRRRRARYCSRVQFLVATA